MTIPLPQNKLHIPAMSSALVSRPALRARLDHCLHTGCKLALISAPAGFGKTTLTGDWVRTLRESPTPPHLVWLSLDPEDNDHVRFWSAFVAALRTVPALQDSGVGESLMHGLDPSTTAPLAPTPPVHALLTGLINDLLGHLAGPLVFVLDDLHCVDEMSIHNGLVYLVDHLPEQMHVVVCSRVDPPWPLAQLRVRGQLVELRARELRFTIEDVTAFLNEIMALNLTTEDVVTLNERTEGWIAGLKMAALSLRDRTDKTAFINAFGGSHRFVLDYLVEQVLNQQPDDIQAFLLETSILDRLSAPLCDAVRFSFAEPPSSSPEPAVRSGQATSSTGSGKRLDSQAVLERLERDNLFIVPLDDERHWYRYHHLFADLLRRRLGAWPDLVPVLHRAASVWFEQHNLMPDATAHALAAKEDARAAALIEAQALEVFARGEFSQIQRWLDMLSEERIRLSPVLCVARAWTLRAYADLEAVESWLRHAEAGLASDAGCTDPLGQEIQSTVKSNIAVIRAINARSHSDPLETQMALLQHARQVVPESDLAMRSSISTWLGLCYMDLGDEGAAEGAFIQAWQIGLLGKGHWAAMVAVYARTIIARWHGRLHNAADLCRQALDVMAQPVEGSARRLVYGADIYTILGRILLEWNDLDGAEQALSSGLAARTPGGINEIAIKGRFAQARLKIARGQIDAIPELSKLVPASAGGLAAFAAALEAWLCLMSSGRAPVHPQASAWWRRARQWAEPCQLAVSQEHWEIIERLVCARVRIAQARAGEFDDLQPVLDFLDAQTAFLQDKDWIELLIQALIVKALALQAVGQEKDALVPLERALALAAPERYTRVFLDEGPPLMRLVAVLAERGSEAGKRLLGDRRDARQLEALIEPLSERELDVLRLLNSDLSRPDIARTLYVSVNTVRSHLRHIYEKLGVHSREEAVQRAQALGLL